MLQWTLGCIYLFKLDFLFSSDKYPEVGLLDHMVVLFLTFWGTSILFSVVAAWITFPPTVYKGFFFFTFSPTLVIFCLFDHCHSDRCKVINTVFWFAFPWWLVMLSIFSCACRPSVCLRKNVSSGPLSIFKLGFSGGFLVFFFVFWVFLFYFWILSCKNSLYSFAISSLWNIWFMNSVSYLFILLMVSFALQKHFSLM